MADGIMNTCWSGNGVGCWAGTGMTASKGREGCARERRGRRKRGKERGKTSGGRGEWMTITTQYTPKGFQISSSRYWEVGIIPFYRLEN